MNCGRGHKNLAFFVCSGETLMPDDTELLNLRSERVSYVLSVLYPGMFLMSLGIIFAIFSVPGYLLGRTALWVVVLSLVLILAGALFVHRFVRLRRRVDAKLDALFESSKKK